MPAWRTCSLLVVFIGTYLLVTAHSVAQTVERPRPTTGDTTPSVRRKLELPGKVDKNLETRSLEEAFPCEEVHAEMRRRFENLERVCSDPRGFSGELLKLNWLRTQWVQKRCATRDIDADLKRDAQYMLETGIESVRVRCVGLCFDEAADLVEAYRCEQAGARCRECGHFSIPGVSTERELGCKGVEMQCVKARLIRDAKEGAEGAKEAFQEALRLLREHAERETENVKKLTP